MFLAGFRDHVYIFPVNISQVLAVTVQPVIFELLRSMYQVPLNWGVHGATVQWFEASIPPNRDLRLLCKGLVLGLNRFCPEKARWSRRLPALVHNARPVMQVPFFVNLLCLLFWWSMSVFCLSHHS